MTDEQVAEQAIETVAKDTVSDIVAPPEHELKHLEDEFVSYAVNVWNGTADSAKELLSWIASKL